MTASEPGGLSAFGLRTLRSSFLGGSGGVLVAALVVGNVGNLAFHVAVTRLMMPAAYGPLVALLGGLLILVVPLTAIQAAVTAEVAARRERPGKGTPAIRQIVLRFAVGGLVTSALLALLAPVVKDFLKLSTPTPVALLGLLMIPALVGLVPRGLLLGERRFGAVAAAVVSAVVVRLVAGVAFTWAGLGLEGALAATVLGEAVACCMLLVAVRPALAGPAVAPSCAAPLQLRLSGVLRPIAAFSGFWALVGIDVLLVQHYFAREVASSYGAAGAAARAALFLPGAVALVAFPTFAATGGSGPRARRALHQALFAVGLIGAATAGALSAFPGLTVDVLFGRAYVGPPAVIRLIALSSVMAGLVGVLLHFHVATRSSASLLVWVGVVVACGAVQVWHESTEQVAVAMAVTITAVFVSMLVAARTRDPTRHGAKIDDPASIELNGVGTSPVDLSLVVPYYNPGEALRANLSGLVEALNESEVTFEIIPVADGCTDGSDCIVRDWPDETVHGVTLATRQGKGAALRVGLAVGRGRYLGFIDGDGDLDPRLMLPFVDLIRVDRPDIVLGSKRHPQSEVVYPPVRRLYSWAYQQLIRILFRLEIRDTQTGLKLIRRDVLANVLPLMVERRFVFDLELFVVARQLGYTDFVEAPVRIRQRFDSTISLVAVVHMLWDTLSVFYRLKVGQAYARPHVPELHPHEGLTLPGGVGTAVR